ncbi:flippase-like domain-containing protein [Paenibacillus sp. MZ04-78.2]|uniref:lysylphosphatidylglycerol synthase transmembrane domain-containing protein n=1 Tax=Paenibacillus sp. MZ04-78.2 TaxID=2962034 RepID=UPI0020B8F1D2|nr:lysylphosphatidylglycerol synthase transmembrane domain-containing protein [Paenibacillus sp. MZ04-78.2]MCP3774578.1 flippase-like domain-containing protein [Paenibacillus sp. MZ04-78.2]
MEQKEKKIESKIVLGIIIGVVVFIVFAFFGDVNVIFNTILQIDTKSLILALVIVCCSYIIRFIKWNYLINAINIKISFSESFSIFFAGRALSITPGKVGELFKAYILKKRYKIDISYSSPAIIMEWFSDFFGILIIIGLSIFVFSYGYILFFLALFFMLLITAVLQSKKLSLRIIDYICKLSFLKKRRVQIEQLYTTIFGLLGWKTLLYIIFLSSCSWFLEALSLYIITNTLGLSLSLLHNLFIFSLGTLTGAISMLPGGLGATEVSMTGLFLYFQIDKSTAISLTLIARLVTLWLGVFIGLFFLLRYRD